MEIYCFLTWSDSQETFYLSPSELGYATSSRERWEMTFASGFGKVSNRFIHLFSHSLNIHYHLGNQCCIRWARNLKMTKIKSQISINLQFSIEAK